MQSFGPFIDELLKIKQIISLLSDNNRYIDRQQHHLDTQL